MLRVKPLAKFRTILQACKITRSPYQFNVARSLTTRTEAEEAKGLNWQCRVDLATAFKGLEMMNFNEGICNHLSLMAPAADGDGKVMLMLPYGYHWREVEPDLLVGLNDKGEVIEGDGEVEMSARTIHAGIHKARPDAICAFHLHSPYATALGMLKDLPFDMYHQLSCYFYNDFAYDQDYGGLSFDMDEGDRIAKHIGNKRVLFMCNHGVMVVGKSVALAFNDAYYIERACYFQTIAMSTGRELQKLSDDVIKLCKEQYDSGRDEYAAAFFESIKRIVKKGR